MRVLIFCSFTGVSRGTSAAQAAANEIASLFQVEDWPLELLSFLEKNMRVLIMVLTTTKATQS